ncbi:MAG: thioredoxin family protein [Candidatus Aphodosoma sp.]
MKRAVLLIPILFLAASAAIGQTPVVKHINKAEFLEQVWNYELDTTAWKYRGTLPCIIDFYTTWCGPCKRLAPILEELAVEYKGQIVIYKVNTEVERELAATFGIRSIPTLFFCPKNGNPQVSKGLLPKETLKEIIDGVLLEKTATKQL